jgi:voltage-gated potassium channel
VYSGRSDNMLEHLREIVRSKFAPRRHTALLVAIIAAFSVRPLIGDAGAGPILFSMAMVLLLLIALFNINLDELMGERGSLLAQNRRRRIIGWVLALAAITERMSLIFVRNRMVSLIGSISWLLFFSFVTVSELRGVLRHREVTTETISMSISVYLLLGATWAFLYVVIFQLQPGAFSSLTLPNSSRMADLQPVFPIFGYFSLGTLSTIGGGDISPISLQARYASVAEAITGQFYLAILVARLVGMHMSQFASRRTEDKTHGSDA